MKRFAWCPARSEEPEWLDATTIPTADLRANLQELRQLNHYLGSCRLVRRAVQQLWQRAGCPSHWRVLDIGVGAGDIPLRLQRWGQEHGVQVTVVAIEAHSGIIQEARQVLQGHQGVALLQADGLQLPLFARSVDVAICSTMLHHLSWHEGVTLLRAMAAVARYGIVVNDLVRGWLPYYGARLLLALWARNRLTRHDGPLSVLRAYNTVEVRRMAQEAGCAGAQVRLALGYRVMLLYTPGKSS